MDNNMAIWNQFNLLGADGFACAVLLPTPAGPCSCCAKGLSAVTKSDDTSEVSGAEELFTVTAQISADLTASSTPCS